MRLRRLPDVRESGDRRWFEPALARLRSLRDDPDARIRSFLSTDAPLYVARAPGRLDVMGGIADYSGALVLELPLANTTSAVVQRQPVPRCDLATRRGDAWHFFSVDLVPLLAGELREPEGLAAWIAERSADHWPAYLIGVVQHCLRRAVPLVARTTPGFRVLVDSAVPEGRGVASSAALEVAAMAAVAASCGTAMAAEEMARACQWVENHVVGAPCGLMDQMTSACGRSGKLLRLRCQPGTIEGHVDVPAGYAFYGIDSGVSHAVTGADYGTVRTAAFMGYRIMADLAGLAAAREGVRMNVTDSRWRGYLANVTPAEYAASFERHLPGEMSGAEFVTRYGGITDPVTRVNPERRYPVRNATAHPVREQARIERFAELLGTPGVDAAREMGRMMAESHLSYGACGLGSEGTDRLVELVAEAGEDRGLFGAKITGGGSGGTVAVFGRDTAEDAVSGIADRYGAETGRPARVFSGSGPGADETGVLLLEPADAW